MAHLSARLLHGNRRTAIAVVLTVCTILATVVVTLPRSVAGAADQNMAAGTTLNVSCAGASLTANHTGATALSLYCSDNSSQPIQRVGQATSFTSGSSSTPTTPAPTGLSSGDVLVSYVETFSFASVTCPSGWSQAFDVDNGFDTRLVACIGVAGAGDNTVTANVTPATQVSMVTVAFSGVDTTNPVDASAGVAGPQSPSVTTDVPNTELVLGEGSDAWNFVPRAPSGSVLGATINDSGNSQVAVATETVPGTGATRGAFWPVLASSAAGTVALRPATGALPPPATGAPATGNDTMSVGTSLSVRCAGTSLVSTSTSATTMTLSCLSAQPVTQQGQATTFSSGSSSSPTTALPDGVSAGDVLVSYVETFSFADISCDAGWTQAFDVANDSGVRLSACTTVAGANQDDPMANVSPATQVSMVTMAFSGVDPNNPVDTSASSTDGVSPSVTTHTTGSVLVLGEGSQGWQLDAGAPPGATLGASVNDGGNSQAAMATEPAPAAGTTPAAPWRVSQSSAAPESGTIALRPASSSDPSTTTTTTAPPPTTTTTAPPPTTTTPGSPGSTTTTTPPGSGTGSGSGSATVAPTAPPAQVCGNSALLSGPPTAPVGAITVPAGNNSAMNLGQSAVYWFAPGVHTIGSSSGSQIIPSNNATYIGAPGAIISGQNINGALFEQHATRVTIEYLTIENFATNTNEGVVNHDSGTNWTIRYNTIENNGGGGVMLGTGDVLSYNCITNNGQLGFNVWSPNGVTGVTVDHNEISNNGSWNQNQSCGCDGGGKFFFTANSSFTNNYIHDNAASGLWGDTNNEGITITGNYIARNYSHAIFYEISYNALIEYNTMVDNGWGEGPGSANFPEGAVYISNSGGDSRVDNGKYSTLLIANNVFTDNWGGVVEWEDSNRYCGSPDGGSTSCTLGNPAANLTDGGQRCGTNSDCSAVTGNTCAAPSALSPLFWDCRWRTQNVWVTANTFNLTAANVPGCAAGSPSNKNGSQCGYSGTFAQWGAAPYSGTVIENAITFNQNNVFSNNAYVGPWSFEAPEQNAADTMSFGQWQAAPYHQDSGSTIRGS